MGSPSVVESVIEPQPTTKILVEILLNRSAVKVDAELHIMLVELP